MRRVIPKTKKELFVKVLDMWKENEQICISEWCVGDRKKAEKHLNSVYKDLLDMWDRMEAADNAN